MDDIEEYLNKLIKYYEEELEENQQLINDFPEFAGPIATRNADIEEFVGYLNECLENFFI